MRHFVRQLQRHPGFSSVAIFTLALAVGLNAWGFAFLNDTLFRPSPIPDSEQVVAIDRTTPSTQTGNWSPADFDDVRRTQTFLTHFGAYCFGSVNFAPKTEPPEHLRSLQVSGDFFGVFGVAPLLGRVIGPDDDRAGAPAVTVVSEGFWRQHLAADPDAVGRPIRLNGEAVTVIGVMPAAFDHPYAWGNIDMWVPLAFPSWDNRASAWLNGIGRLRPDETLGQAQAAATVIGRRLAHDHPAFDAEAGIHLAPWEAVRRGGTINRNISFFSMAMSLAVLLVACANLANLQLARAAGRSREFGIRLALGSSRSRLVRHLLAENVVISLAGGALGILIAQWGLKWTEAALDPAKGLSRALHFGLAEAGFALCLGVLAGAIFSLMPALFAARTNINASLKQGGRSAMASARGHRLRNFLIASELAVSLMLLAAASYFIGGLNRFQASDWGWHPSGLITGTLTLPFSAAYGTDDKFRAFSSHLEDTLSGLDGVKAAGLTGCMPVLDYWTTHRIAVEGAAPGPAGREPVACEVPVSPGYFAALGIKLIAGRSFNAFDRGGSPAVVVVNQALARKLWPKGDALHQRIKYIDGDEAGWAEVIGVVNDVRTGLSLLQPPRSTLQSYRPLAQVPSGDAHNLEVAVRVAGAPAVVADEMRKAVARIDPDLPVYGLTTASDAIDRLFGGFTVLAKTLTAMACFGVVLASIGIYGVVSNLVVRRTPEIGIRMALGAGPNEVLALVLRSALWLAAIGCGAGLILSLAVNRMLDAILPAMTSISWPLLASITLLLAAVALVASWVPARRATRVDPATALRAE